MSVPRWFLGCACLVAGCESLPAFDPPKSATVSSNPFGLQAANRTAKVNYAPADESLATRVDSVGRKLLAANPQIGLKSTLFATIGNAPQPEMFHVGTRMIYVTDGLVQRCANEGQLAALLAVEIGRVVAERESAASPEMRNPERLPPIEVPMGSNVGQVADLDLGRQAELARFEKERPKNSKYLPPPNPDDLARTYLTKAGFASGELDAARPLLHAAEANIAIERQFKGVITPGGWTP